MEDLSWQVSDIQGSRCEELYAARYFKSISDRESRSDWYRQPILATLSSLPGRFLLAALLTTGETAPDNGLGWKRDPPSETAGWQNSGLTVPWQVADTTDSVRQGTTDPRQGNNPTCFD
jgi:hypothetical protein